METSNFLNPTGKYFDLKEIKLKMSSKNQFDSAGDLFMGFLGERLEDGSFKIVSVAIDKSNYKELI